MSNAERIQAKEAAYKVFRDLETPYEFAVRYTWDNPVSHTTLCILSDLELFKKWQAKNNGAAMTGQQLAEMTGVQDADLLRECWHVAQANFCTDMSTAKAAFFVTWWRL